MADDVSRLRAALAGRYTLERELGRGGMATVWLAQDLKHDRPVALKVLRPELAAALGPARFLREITLTAALDHPHILPLLDSGEASGYLYYAMPFVEGESLRDRLAREKQLPVADALRITRDVADALGYAHSRGVVHRDIKPENILLSGGHARVADLGIATALTAAGGDRLTETGIAVGTPPYMSPEQGAGTRELDGRSDLYSLGCVLYEMLAGHPPFAGATAREVLARHSLDAVPLLLAARPAVPPHVERAISTALAKVPADRFSTAAQFAAALAEVPANGGQFPYGGAGARRRWRPAVLVGLLVAALGAVTAVVARRQAAVPRNTPAERSHRVALLPCENATRDTTQDWLVERWTDELTTRLGQVSTLVVRPYASVRRFTGGAAAPRELATTLAVDYLVSCRLGLRGDRVRLGLTVASVTPDAVIWSRTYERLLRADAYGDLQAVAAHQVASALGAEVTGTSRAQMTARVTRDSVALRLYRQAMATPDWRAKAWLLAQAIERDSGFVLPYFELAGWHFVIARDSITPRQAFKAMDVLLTKALALDSLYPDALGGRADYLLYWERDWPRARSLYERAVALDPNSSNLRLGYSQALGTVGLLKEALVQQHVAAELDPTGQNLCYLGHAYVRANRLGEAEALMRRRLAAAPDEMCSRFVLGYTLASLGRYGDGIRLLEEVDQAWGQNLSLAFLGTAYARAGRAVDAERVLTRLRQRATRAYVDPALMAMVEVALGRRSAALELLAQSVEAGGETSMYYLGPNPWFDPLRNDPRFRALRRQVGVYVDGR